MDAPFAMMIKKRPAHNEAVITHIIGDVAGKTPIIIEDLIDTGTTIVNVVEGLKEKKGANDVYICATHPVFSGPALQRLDHPNINEVVITDSLPIPDQHPSKFTVLSVDRLLSDAIRIIMEGGSISSLFKYGGV